MVEVALYFVNLQMCHFIFYPWKCEKHVHMPVSRMVLNLGASPCRKVCLTYCINIGHKRMFDLQGDRVGHISVTRVHNLKSYFFQMGEYLQFNCNLIMMDRDIDTHIYVPSGFHRLQSSSYLPITPPPPLSAGALIFHLSLPQEGCSLSC